MARLGHAPHVVGAVLNHAPAAVAGITAVYQRYDFASEKRAALARWSAELERIIGRPGSNVVELAR